MQRAIRFSGIAMLVWLVSGCAGTTATPTVAPAQPASPTAIPTPALIFSPPPPTATGVPTSTPSIVFESFEFPRLSVAVPASIASGAESQLIPLGTTDTPTRENFPRHLLIDLKGYPGPTIKYQGPAIRIYTTTGLELVYKNQIQNTRQVIDGSPPDSGIYPALPIVFGTTQLQIRMKPLAFQGGKGFRYLEYENIPSLDTLNNQHMNYVYQGISADGKYYISVILPVTMPFLNDTIALVATQAATMTTPVPEQLLLLPILQKLQSADDSEFSPSLAILDEIIASLNLGQPQ
jgi:hypothetical protein